METEEASIGKANILVTKAGVKSPRLRARSPRHNLKYMHNARPKV